MDLEVEIGRLKLKNPVLVASGTFGYGREYAPFLDLNILGGIVVKGISLKERSGNPPPRLVEVPCGLINAIGLENVGIERFLKEKLPFLKTIDTKIIVNIFGDSIEEYALLAEKLEKSGVDALELNISCPNIKDGLVFGKDKRLAAKVTKAVRNVTDLPIIVKLTPEVTDIVAIAREVINSGADGVSLINTFPAMAVDVNTRRPRLSNITGGLSGPCLKPISLKMVWDIVRTLNIPTVGIGGIFTAQDALEYLIVGAKAVQIGTANFINPKVSVEVLEGIKSYLKNNGFKDINDVIGSLIV
ncbi:MAG: dihydroorotate dehydrogenase [Deltaproteobacteria bacterium]|nr:dihydroorotate dehydrogenase [Deltaproteobacteria bacterium]